MKKGEPRRLTGGNLLMGGAGATIDLYFDAPGARDAFVEELKVELAFFYCRTRIRSLRSSLNCNQFVYI